MQGLLESINSKLDVITLINGQVQRAQERQEVHESMFSRAFKEIEKNEATLIFEKDMRKESIQLVKDDVSKWVNRGVGAWFVLGAVGVIGVGVIVYFFNTGTALLANHSAMLQAIDRRVLVIEQSNKGN